jgi:hypothetical protein
MIKYSRKIVLNSFEIFLIVAKGNNDVNGGFLKQLKYTTPIDTSTRVIKTDYTITKNDIA